MKFYMNFNLLLFICFNFINFVLSDKLYKIEGWVTNNPYLNEQVNFKNIKVVLDNNKYKSIVSNQGRFVIHGVPLGTYSLKVYSPNYYFEQYRVDLNLNEDKKLVISAYPLRLGAAFDQLGDPLPLPLKLSPKVEYEFFTERPKFSIFSIVSNPMILMTGVSLIMLFILPRMLKDLDPEVLKEVQQTQNSLHSTLNKFKDGPSLSETLAKFSK